MFRKSYKELYSQKVPEELIKETVYKAYNYKADPLKRQRKSFKFKIAVPIAAALAAAIGIGGVFSLFSGGYSQNENTGFVLRAAAAEIDNTASSDGCVELSTSESTFGWTDSNGNDGSSDFFLEYKLSFKIKGKNISSIRLDAGDLYLSDTPFSEGGSFDSHTYEQTFDITQDEEQNIEITNLYYTGVSDKTDEIADEMASKIYNSQKKENRVKYENRRQSGDSSAITSELAELESITNGYICDLAEYAFRNAEITVTASFSDGTYSEQKIYADFYVNQAVSTYEENVLEPLYNSVYEDYESVFSTEKVRFSDYWLSFKYYENGKPDSIEKYREAISAAKNYTEMYGGYYLDDSGSLVILMTNNYAEGENPQLDEALEAAEIGNCDYSKSELCDILDKACSNLYDCYDMSTDYLNVSFRTDIKSNRLLCVIDDEISADDAENLKENVRQNIIDGMEKYFEFVTFKAK